MHSCASSRPQTTKGYLEIRILQRHVCKARVTVGIVPAYSSLLATVANYNFKEASNF